MSRLLKRKAAALLLIAAVAVVMLAATSVHVSAASSKYWIKINKKKCVATVYKKTGGKWKPYRAMLCAVGKGSTPTPSGTFHLGGKYRWIRMVTEGKVTYEQYTTRFHGEYYLHSPCYASPSKSKEKAHTYYTLGKHVTHGCVRFCVMDAKWIYENCKRGTKVTIYKSSKAGPLGKPEKVKYVKKHGRAWDPTDPDKRNPHFRMRPPQFTINKAKTVLYGRKYTLKSGVKVMNTNANQNLTGKMKITRLTRYGNAISVKKFTTKSLGEYKVTYYVKDKYCIKKGGKGTSETFTFQVIDKSVINGTAEKAAELADKALETGAKANLLKGITAKSLSRNLTSSIKVLVVAPDGSQQTLTTAEAKAFVFEQGGTYKVTYSVTNPYPKKAVKKTIKVAVTEPELEPEPEPEPQPEPDPEQPDDQDNQDQTDDQQDQNKPADQQDQTDDQQNQTQQPEGKSAVQADRNGAAAEQDQAGLPAEQTVEVEQAENIQE